MKTTIMQVFRVLMMILAVAGVIYALEYMNGGLAMWFWVLLLAVGFVGLLYSFRMTQRIMAIERRERERVEKKKARKARR